MAVGRPQNLVFLKKYFQFSKKKKKKKKNLYKKKKIPLHRNDEEINVNQKKEEKNLGTYEGGESDFGGTLCLPGRSKGNKLILKGGLT